MEGELVKVDLYQLARSLLLLAALLAPLPASAQYQPYGSSNNQQQRQIQSRPAYVPPFQQRYPEPARGGQSVIYQGGKPKVCSTYANTTYCP